MTKPKRERGYGSLFRFKNSSFWWLKYTDKHGNVIRKSSGTANRNDAKRMLDKEVREVLDGKRDINTERMTVRELFEDLLLRYRLRGRKSIPDLQARWRHHLNPYFGCWKASRVNSTDIAKYTTTRLEEGAAPGTVNRELAAIRTMFRYGYINKKVLRPLHVEMLKEDNARKGFVEAADYAKLAAIFGTVGLWMRALFECGYYWGWRVSELVELTVAQVDLFERIVTLDPGTTKNDDGRYGSMTDLIYELLAQCVQGKNPDDYVFTRENGTPVGDFRDTWAKACIAAGLGKRVHVIRTEDDNDVCGTVAKRVCSGCGRKVKRHETRYVGLIFHDLRRTAVRNLIRAGVPEHHAMKVTGHKTAEVFRRYNIVNKGDVVEAMKMVEADQKRKASVVRAEFGQSPQGTEKAVPDRTRPN